VSNLRQLGVAFSLYLQDYDRGFPRAAPYNNGPEPSSADWILNVGAPGIEGVFDVERGALGPYVKSREIFASPSDGDRRAADRRQTHHRWSYAMNNLLQFEREAALTFPATTFLLLEDDEYDLNDGYFYVSGAYSAEGPRNPDQAAGDRPEGCHFDGSHVLHCDGHARWYPLRRIIASRYTNDVDPPLPPRDPGELGRRYCPRRFEE
jgi:hypothetical protein